MHLLDLKIKKIAIHQIFQRDPQGNKITPKKSVELINFDMPAMETFKQRVVNALGSQSKAVNMVIVNQGSKDVSSLIQDLSTANDKDFLNLSYKVADLLAEAQKKKKLPGGIVVVFRGSFGPKPKRKKIVGIMKAEIHSAYEKTENELTKQISLKYVEEALLTPATKLFKTAGFAEKGSGQSDDLNNLWEVHISDSQISQTDGKAAAQYFYSDFLGCGYPETSARHTKAFYDTTCAFIDKLEVSVEKKNDLRNALVSYLKIENNITIDGNEFGERYFSPAVQDEYNERLEDAGLPNTAFIKDTEHITSKLKTRKLSFSNNIKITAPSEKFQDLIEIETIKENDGEKVNWTKILVKDRIVTQE
ncbi:nucleoid-associated protein [Vibrio sp. M260112]|uniref:nucleoid-associated protein n=1 Tax=Vibrio sp. M260112 TaxID=3020895 RepID=UPI002F3FF649